MKFLVVLVVVVGMLWLLLGRSRRGGDARSSDAGSNRPDTVEGMLTCAHCGVHLPVSEALRLGEHAFCSEAHRDRGPRVR